MPALLSRLNAILLALAAIAGILVAYWKFQTLPENAAIYHGPGAPTKADFAAPARAMMADTKNIYYNGYYRLSLFGCVLHGPNIICFLTLTRLGGAPGEARISAFFNPGNVKLYDQVPNRHTLLHAGWIDTQGKPADKILIDLNHPTWLSLTFQSPAHGQGAATIVTHNVELKAPIAPQ